MTRLGTRCECSENECSAVVELSGVTIVANVEQLVKMMQRGVGAHCDCIVVRCRESNVEAVEVYMVELKDTKSASLRVLQGILGELPVKMQGCAALSEKLVECKE